MCDVPSIAVFCSESIECFPGRVSKFFLKLFVTIPVTPVITGTIVHFRFHIRCISGIIIIIIIIIQCVEFYDAFSKLLSRSVHSTVKSDLVRGNSDDRNSVFRLEGWMDGWMDGRT